MIPIGTALEASGGTTLIAEGMVHIAAGFPPALVLALLPLINIFLYKNRKLQLRISVYAIILAFGLIGLIYYYFVIGFRQLDEPAYALRFPLVVPVIFIVLIYLAFRGIRKDEILVRSLDRIR